MQSYIIQVVLFQLLFLVVYEVLLKKETFFSYNRAYLLLTPVLAFLLPIINIEMLSGFVPQESVTSISRFWLPEVNIGGVTQNTQQLPEIVLSKKSHSFNWMTIIYCIGAIVSLGIVGKKLFNLRKLFKFNVISKVKQFNIVEIPSSNVACTFNKTIFLGDELTAIEKEQIVAHELIHVEQKHSYDLVIFEILKIIFWFNPLIYIYQNRIAALHEFIADSNVIKIVEKRSYYEQLLNTAFNTQNISFINQFFNHSLIKKRIVMLQKSKSKTNAKFKYLVILPLMLIMLTIVSCTQEGPEEMAKESSISKQLAEIKQALDEGKELSEVERDQFFSIMEQIVKEESDLPLPPPQYSDKSSSNGIPGSDVPFALIDQVPLFPGCESLSSNEEQKKCMTNKITEFVSENFNTKIGEDLKLTGVNRVVVQFKIDKNGNIVNVRARAPHPSLEEEAKRVINALPKMIPGEQKGKPVGVMYSLPIVFQVHK
ncbi:beta-lactamase regulating signal transducer with metallopeptidase domain [Gillisia mitskevichiae]|uniref:Beta-lactamase regulating signal transducer with metallopeptidase domain n=1 Tax=Gillisia mitskevichiae TaxID=270921 RepID=A0A495PZE4_9FLAO|nr:beta-lactamase regulating signal transducer with metallopeptidase domain [Gillisia mitskevichiae]